MDPRIKWLNENVHGNRILDIGCAAHQGFIHKTLCKHNTSSYIVGIDIDKTQLNSLVMDIGANKTLFKNNNFVSADGMTLPFKTGSFDTTFLGEIIEHLFYPRNLLREVYRVLEAKCRLYITTPNILAFHRILRYIIQGKVAMGDPEHLTLFDPYSLTTLLQTEGFRVLSIETKRIYVPIPFFKRSIGPFNFSVPPFSRLGANICITANKL